MHYSIDHIINYNHLLVHTAHLEIQTKYQHTYIS